MQSTKMRTHLCSEVDADDGDVSLCGWVNSVRDHGGVLFIDLRDYTGLIQVVADPSKIDDFEAVNNLKREDCIRITGTIRNREKNLINPRIKTGYIEVVMKDMKILNKSTAPPFEIEDGAKITDEIRHRFRYLDLRRSEMQKNIRKRSEMMQEARRYLTEKERFTEIETPNLVRSTPEGARDFIVPSRVNRGKFYALPQAPQLYKQLLMIAGFDRYFQFARCFRDEALRSDRQPEFTQLDIEMSFIEKEDIMRVTEGIVEQFYSVFNNKKPKFKRMRFDEAIRDYSTDRPDTRFGLKTIDVTDVVRDSDFGVFTDVSNSGGLIKCINPEKDLTRKELDDYIAFCQGEGAKGMAWMKVKDGKVESSITKYFSDDIQKRLIKSTGAKDGSTLMFIADKRKVCLDVISRLRLKVAHDLDMIDEKKKEFLWITDFPLFEKDEDGDLTPSHHMFTMPRESEIHMLDEEPESVTAEQYDLVFNGFEIAGGSIRCHRPDIQKKIMKIIGFPEEKAKERFGFLLDALDYGAPPHGGIAFGFDRMASLLSGTSDIREVMAFPKNKNGQCTMDGSPGEVTEKQLRELHIKIRD